jgi:hypothetical protein
LTDAKAFLHARDTGQNLLGDYVGVRNRLGIAQTQVTGLARYSLVLLTKILDESAVAAHGAPAITIHVIEVLEGIGEKGRIDLVVPGRFLHDSPPRHRVYSAVEQNALGFQTVASGAADLLLIVLYRLGHAGVQHKADIRAIDAHAEGNCGDDQVALLGPEGVLRGRPLFGR